MMLPSAFNADEIYQHPRILEIAERLFYPKENLIDSSLGHPGLVVL